MIGLIKNLQHPAAMLLQSVDWKSRELQFELAYSEEVMQRDLYQPRIERARDASEGC